MEGAFRLPLRQGPLQRHQRPSMLFALQYPEGGEIIVPDYSTWFPVVPMRFFGLVPVFVDVDPAP